MKKLHGYLKTLVSTFAPALILLALFKGGSFLSKANPIDTIKLKAEIESDAPVLLQFHAYWCSTCLIQKTNLKIALRSKDFQNIHFHSVDFDSENELKTQYSVSTQSTLILLKNRKEIARAIGMTSKDELETFLKRGEN